MCAMPLKLNYKYCVNKYPGEVAFSYISTQLHGLVVLHFENGSLVTTIKVISKPIGNLWPPDIYP